MRLRLLLPQVNPQSAGRPKTCRWCSSPLLQRHQSVPKALIDTQVREAEVVRYRCTTCRRTFRHYPEGVSHYRQGQRVMASPSFSGPWGFPSGRRVTFCTP